MMSYLSRLECKSGLLAVEALCVSTARDLAERHLVDSCHGKMVR